MTHPTVRPEPTRIKVNGWWQILPQHQSKYLRGPEYALIEILPVRPHFMRFSNFVSSQHSHLEVNFGLRGGILIDTDSGPLRYVLWCCGSICHQLFTFCGLSAKWGVKTNYWTEKISVKAFKDNQLHIASLHLSMYIYSFLSLILEKRQNAWKCWYIMLLSWCGH